MQDQVGQNKITEVFINHKNAHYIIRDDTVWVAQLVRVLAHNAGDPGSNPGPGKNFSLKLTTQDLPEGYSEKLNFHQNSSICAVNIKTSN